MPGTIAAEDCGAVPPTTEETAPPRRKKWVADVDFKIELFKDSEEDDLYGPTKALNISHLSSLSESGEECGKAAAPQQERDSFAALVVGLNASSERDRQNDSSCESTSYGDTGSATGDGTLNSELGDAVVGEDAAEEVSVVQRQQTPPEFSFNVDCMHALQSLESESRSPEVPAFCSSFARPLSPLPSKTCLGTRQFAPSTPPPALPQCQPSSSSSASSPPSLPSVGSPSSLTSSSPSGSEDSTLGDAPGPSLQRRGVGSDSGKSTRQEKLQMHKDAVSRKALAAPRSSQRPASTPAVREVILQRTERRGVVRSPSMTILPCTFPATLRSNSAASSPAEKKPAAAVSPASTKAAARPSAAGCSATGVEEASDGEGRRARQQSQIWAAERQRRLARLQELRNVLSGSSGANADATKAVALRAEATGPASLYKRGEAWLEKKRLREQEMRAQRLESEVSECTFQPSTAVPSPRGGSSLAIRLQGASRTRAVTPDRARRLFERHLDWRQKLEDRCEEQRRRQRDSEEREIQEIKARAGSNPASARGSSPRRSCSSPRGAAAAAAASRASSPALQATKAPDLEGIFEEFHARNRRWQEARVRHLEQLHDEQCAKEAGPRRSRSQERLPSPGRRTPSTPGRRLASPRAGSCGPGERSSLRHSVIEASSDRGSAPSVSTSLLVAAGLGVGPGSQSQGDGSSSAGAWTGIGAGQPVRASWSLATAADEGGGTAGDATKTSAAAAAIPATAGAVAAPASPRLGERHEVLSHLQTLRLGLLHSQGRSSAGWEKALRVETARLKGAGAAPLRGNPLQALAPLAQGGDCSQQAALEPSHGIAGRAAAHASGDRLAPAEGFSDLRQDAAARSRCGSGRRSAGNSVERSPRAVTGSSAGVARSRSRLSRSPCGSRRLSPTSAAGGVAGSNACTATRRAASPSNTLAVISRQTFEAARRGREDLPGGRPSVGPRLHAGDVGIPMSRPPVDAGQLPTESVMVPFAPHRR
eukprot:TRINITY_DN41764_c0_g1_i1.p1 TRINITY_DN41764_c0_g1~~TRINITY_DN41764_c0_g1_i1.p1  ORF type:complete len:994 (+),score=208.92 TRINITY_DN41764_c0_g1_i1:131-3112(+)